MTLSAEPLSGELTPSRLTFTTDPELMAACVASVDPLEIAALLESSGFSTKMVNERFGVPDVFSLADRIFAQLPYAPGPGPKVVPPRRGGPRDLVRGGLFAVPTALLFTAIHGLALTVVWWSLPLALIWGWSVSQGMVVTVYAVRPRNREGEETFVLAGWLVLTGCGGGVIGLIAMRIFGGGYTEVVLAVAVAGYMVAASVLTLFAEELWLAVALLPGGLGFLAFTYRHQLGLPARLAGLAVVVTIAATFLAAVRHLRGRWVAPAALGPGVRGTVLRYMLYGACCGLFVSLMVIPGEETRSAKSGAALVSLPLLLTLGIMEWQVWSFRARGSAAAAATSDLRAFSQRTTAAFVRSLSIYVACEAVLSATVAIVAAERYPDFPTALLIAQGLIGASFFVGLVVMTSLRIDLVLRCWLTGITVCATYLGVAWLATGREPTTAPLAYCLASAGLLLGLLVCARRVVRTPLSF